MHGNVNRPKSAFSGNTRYQSMGASAQVPKVAETNMTPVLEGKGLTRSFGNVRA